MSIKRIVKPIGVLILSAIIFLNGCDAGSPSVIQESGAPVSLKKIKHRIAGSHNSIANQWVDSADPCNPQITVSTGNFWDRLRGSFQLNHYSDNPKVKAQINWFVHHQGYLNRSVKRASPYMYYIFEQVQKRNLPGELLLLPFIESAFNPFAYSGPGAAGLWQIMPQTGTGFGLKQNWWYDGRRDVHASTNAALDYLTYLHSYFDGDWLLAIAAYNTGEGTVQSCIRRNAKVDKNTDFFSLGLCQETQSYVPRLLALAVIISNPDDYPISLPPVRDEPYLAEVKIGYQIDLTEAARLACISQEEMRRLNPAYRHKLTRPHSSCRLLLPISHVETFKNNLTQLSIVNQTSMQRYKVKRGETLDKIAEHFQVSTAKLRQMNHLKSQKLRPGRLICVPVESPMITGKAKAIEVAEEINDKPDDMIDPVNKSNHRASLASKNKQAIESQIETELQKESEKNERPLESPRSFDVSSESQKVISHTLKKGETLQKVATRYHVKAKDITRWNHLSKPRKLKVGKTLVIYQYNDKKLALKPTLHESKETKVVRKPSVVKKRSKILLAQPPKRPKLKRTSYKVQKGDSVEKVARKNRVKPSVIRQQKHHPSRRHTIHTKEKY